MIVNLIEAKVSYLKQSEKGFIKKTWEKYLISDISLSAAESRICELIAPLSTDGEVNINSLSHTKYEEVIGMDEYMDSDSWFHVKVYYLFVDEKTGKDKREPHDYLVRASNTQDASVKMNIAMAGSLSDYKIDRVIEMGYADVFLEE